MDYYGLLFLYYLKGLSGKSILRLFFNIETGGTEQLLPENTSTPTTTPILADIQYPDGLRTDQYFTYRETPTTVSNKARIKTIKGNTLVWNQLVENGNFALASGWTAASIDFNITIGNDMATLEVVTPKDSAILQGNVLGTKQDHFYYAVTDFKYDVAPGSSESKRIFIGSGGYDGILKNVTQSNTWVTVSGFFKRNTGGNDTFRIYPRTGGMSVGDKIYVRNVMIVDLTALFGVDKALELWHMENTAEGSGVAYFRSLFPLPYYAYNQGTLLSFNGNGIKTVGKNLASGISQGAVDIHGGTTSNEKRLRVDGFVRVFQGDHYTFTATSNSGKTLQIYTRYFADANGSEQVSYLDWLNLPRSVIIPSGVNYATFTIRFGNNDSITLNDVSDVQIEHGALATSYEPYESHTTNLPIATYFPTGMKSAGSVYDELTPTKAITRIGAVDLGSLDWSYITIGSALAPYFMASFTGIKSQGNPAVNKANIICSNYETVARNDTNFVDKRICADGSPTVLSQIQIKDSSYTDATAFKSAMSGQYLYYELAEYQETPITTEDANEALSLLMGKSVSSNNAKQMIDIITKGE